MKLVSKIEDAKKFQAILTPKNKEIIEKSLDSIDPCSCYSASIINEFLKSTIGKRETIFLKNLIDLNDFKSFVKGLKDITPENLNYFNWLYAKYSSKLRGALSNSLLRKPDGWVSFFKVSTKYDTSDEELLLKIAIVKVDKECAIFEDSYGGMFDLSSIILAMINDEDIIAKFKTNVDITKEQIGNMRINLDLLDQRLFGNGDEKKEPTKEEEQSKETISQHSNSK